MKVRESIIKEILDGQLKMLLGDPGEVFDRLSKRLEEVENEVDETNPFILMFIKSNLGAALDALNTGVRLGREREAIADTMLMITLSWLQVVRSFDKEEEIRKLEALLQARIDGKKD